MEAPERLLRHEHELLADRQHEIQMQRRMLDIEEQELIERRQDIIQQIGFYVIKGELGA